MFQVKPWCEDKEYRGLAVTSGRVLGSKAGITEKGVVAQEGLCREGEMGRCREL